MGAPAKVTSIHPKDVAAVAFVRHCSDGNSRGGSQILQLVLEASDRAVVSLEISSYLIHPGVTRGTLENFSHNRLPCHSQVIDRD